MRMPVPASLAEHADRAPSTPAAPRDAATVALLRDGPDGVEAYLMRRQRSMAFAAGMYVFPGGGVDRRDADASIGWAGPILAQWSARLACTQPSARALVCAAVRETFEESGILLAGPDAASIVADTCGVPWAADRVGLEHRDHSLAELLQRRNLVLRTDLLAAWTHWITPEFEPRRFDTRFFVAALPDGQRVGELAREADRADWMPLRATVEAVDAGAVQMLPPTYVTCGELARLDRAADALTAAAGRTIAPILPRLVSADGRPFLEAELP